MFLNEINFFFSDSNRLVDTHVPETATIQRASEITNNGKGQECEQSTTSTLSTQALINTSPHDVQFSERQSKGLRHSDPLRPSSNINKFEPNLSVLPETSFDETNENLLLSNSKQGSVESENKYIHNQKCLSDQENNLLIPTQAKHQPSISPCLEAEEEIKSVKSEVFFDAEEELPGAEKVENEREIKHLQRRCGRDESNFSRSLLRKLSQGESTDETDRTSKQKNTLRNVSFSKASRRWSQLRSARKMSLRLSRLSRRQSTLEGTDGSDDNVELRRKR